MDKKEIVKQLVGLYILFLATWWVYTIATHPYLMQPRVIKLCPPYDTVYSDKVKGHWYELFYPPAYLKRVEYVDSLEYYLNALNSSLMASQIVENTSFSISK